MQKLRWRRGCPYTLIEDTVRVVLIRHGDTVEQGEAGSDSLGADAVSQNATNDGDLELCSRCGAGLTV